MTTESPGRSDVVPASWLRAIIIPLLLSILTTTICYIACGASLGLFFGGLVFGLILAPPIVLAQESGWQRVFAVALLIDGIGIVWLVALFSSPLTFWQWLQVYLVLSATIAAFAASALLLRSMRVNVSIASAIVTLVALAWMSWPIWLSPALGSAASERVVGWLVRLHPLMAINGALQPNLGIWTQSRLMYRLTNLGQDVPYQLPASIAPAMIAHLAVAGVCIGLMRSGKWRTLRSTNQIDTTASPNSNR
jgi:hypothetical protein